MEERARPSFVRFFAPTEEQMTPEERHRFNEFYKMFAAVQPALPEELDTPEPLKQAASQ